LTGHCLINCWQVRMTCIVRQAGVGSFECVSIISGMLFICIGCLPNSRNLRGCTVNIYTKFMSRSPNFLMSSTSAKQTVPIAPTSSPSTTPSETDCRDSRAYVANFQESVKDMKFYLGASTTKNELEWIANGSSRVLVSKVAAAKSKVSEAVEPAVLSLIMHVSPDNCWIRSDAYWKPKGPVKLHELKLHCWGVSADETKSSKDFKQAVITL
jgi:hypothetical protein